MSHIIPTDKSPGPGPDMFFAGGECWSRFGVLVRRTDMDLEAATRPTHTRNSVGSITRGDGIVKRFGIDLPRVDWFNDADLDPTRNLISNTDLTNRTFWGNSAGLEPITGAPPGLFSLTDPTDTQTSFTRHTGPDIRANATLTLSLRLKKQIGGNTFNLELIHGGTIHGLVIDPETGVINNIGPVDAIRVTDLGTEFLVEVVSTNVGENFNVDLFPAWAPPGDTTTTQFNFPVGTARVRNVQVEFGDVATAFQSMPRNREYRFPNLFLEDAGANTVLFSEQFDNAVWNKTRITITPDVELSPDGQVTADKLIEDTSVSSDRGFSFTAPGTTGDNQTQAISIWAKADTRHWMFIHTISFNNDVGRTWFDLNTGFFGTIDPLHTRVFAKKYDNGWYRIQLNFDSSSGATGSIVAFDLAEEDGDAIYTGDGVSGLFMWGAQWEHNTPSGATSYMPTDATQPPRAADSFAAPYDHTPTRMSVYAKYLERGTVEVSGRRLWELGSNPRLLMQATGTAYILFHNNSLSSVTASLVTRPAIGDLVEMLGHLFEDGSINLIQIINGTEREETGRTPVPAIGGLSTTWGVDPSMFINSDASSTQVGFNSMLALKAQRGIRSMDFMRRL